MGKVIVTSGLIAGLILSAMMVVTMLLLHDTIGLDKGEIIGYTTMVVAFLMVFFGVRSYRDNVVGGDISFGRAFKVGISIALLASACYVATWEVIYYRFMPDFGAKYATAVIAKAKADGASDAEIAKKQTEMAKFQEMYKNPLVNVAFTFLEPLPVGLLFALIAAGTMRRRKDGSAVPAPA